MPYSKVPRTHIVRRKVKGGTKIHVRRPAKPRRIAAKKSK